MAKVFMWQEVMRLLDGAMSNLEVIIVYLISTYHKRVVFHTEILVLEFYRISCSNFWSCDIMTATSDSFPLDTVNLFYLASIIFSVFTT